VRQIVKTVGQSNYKHTNRKPYLTYLMVPYLVTFTDLYTRRAGLSASAELLIVLPLDLFCWQQREIILLFVTITTHNFTS